MLTGRFKLGSDPLSVSPFQTCFRIIPRKKLGTWYACSTSSPSNSNNCNLGSKCDNSSIICCHRQNKRVFGEQEKGKKKQTKKVRRYAFCPKGEEEGHDSPRRENICFKPHSLEKQAESRNYCHYMVLNETQNFFVCFVGVVRKFLPFQLCPSTICYCSKLKIIEIAPCEQSEFCLKHVPNFSLSCGPVQKFILFGPTNWHIRK